MKKVKFVSLFLSGLLTMLVFSSCATVGEDIENESDSIFKTTATDVTSAQESVDPKYIVDVPEVHYNDTEITILQRTAWVHEMFAEEQTGDLINDTVYLRNLSVEERLGIKLNFMDTAGTNTTFSNFSSAITTAANSGDDVYQLVANYAYFGVSMAVNGYFTDLLSIPYVNTTKAWWNQSYVDQATINDKLYYIVGDATTSAMYELEVCYINHSLAEKYYPGEDFYNVVLDGKWTYDYLLEVVTNLTTTGTQAEYGLAAPCNSLSIDGLLIALDVKITDRNSDGNILITMQSDEHLLNVADALKELYHRNTGAFIKENSEPRNLFIEGNAIFLFERMSVAENYLRDVTYSYGIIPMPKWDEAQESYYVTSHDEYSCLCVPSSVSEDKLESVGAFLEVMGQESFINLRPALYETSYKLKYLNDDASSSMFDFIVNGAKYDFGFIYSNCINNPVHILRNYIRYDYSGLSSQIKANQKMMDKLLTTMLEYYK